MKPKKGDEVAAHHRHQDVVLSSFMSMSINWVERLGHPSLIHLEEVQLAGDPSVVDRSWVFGGELIYTTKRPTKWKKFSKPAKFVN